MGPWGPAHGAQKLRSRPGTRVPAAFGPHGLLLGPMGWAPWVHGPYQILKETYQILKETYPILKETYQILGEKYGPYRGPMRALNGALIGPYRGPIRALS